MRRRLWLLSAFVAFVVLLAVGFAIEQWVDPGKSFSLPRVSVEARLDDDGSLHVVEHITYDFDGAFTFGTRPIPKGAYWINNMTVSERGRDLPTIGAPYDVQWFFDAEDERRTFDIAYSVENATVDGTDVTELYWQWVGEDHPTIDVVDVRLKVPAGPGAIRAWGHGPPNGQVDVGADSVRWRAASVPDGELVEGRVAVPAARTPFITPLDGVLLPRIFHEERAAIVATDAARRAALQSETTKHERRDTLQWLAPLVAAFGALGFLLAWRRWGRAAPPPENIGRYVRELPDDPPAVVDALMHWGDVRSNAVGATMIDLAQRGFLTIEQTSVDRGILPDHVDYRYTLIDPAVIAELEREPDEDDDDEDAADDIDGPAPNGVLRGFERATLEQVFSRGSTVTQSELARAARKQRRESSKRWRHFEQSVERNVQARDYLRGDLPLPYVVNVTLAGIVALVAVGALSLGAWIGGGVALAWAAVQLSLTPLLRSRTPKGHLRYHQWLGVRNYLRDFSQLGSAPAGHLVLWERYLVYAVALGVSDDLARGLAAHLPDAKGAVFAPWYMNGGPDGGPGYGSIGEFSDGFAAANAGTFGPPSEHGTGGAFAGGGGEGGGGGGGGGGIGAG
jgi:uncharacterized membrane protein YgcG